MPVSFLVVAVYSSIRWYCTEYDRGRLHIQDLQHFVAVEVDDSYGDLAGFGRVEGAAGGRVEGELGRFVDFGPQGPLELVVGFVGAGAQSAASTPAAVVLVSGSGRSPSPGRDADGRRLVPVRPADPGCRSSARRPPRRGCVVAGFHQPRVSPATRQNNGSWALFLAWTLFLVFSWLLASASPHAANHAPNRRPGIADFLTVPLGVVRYCWGAKYFSRIRPSTCFPRQLA